MKKIKIIFTNRNYIRINLNIFVAICVFLIFSVIVTSDQAFLQQLPNGVWNFESYQNEWYIKNGTMIGWCPKDNCTSVVNSWYSNKMNFKFYKNESSEFLNGEDLAWDCVNTTEPDGLDENETYGNLSRLECTANTNALNNNIRIKLIYFLYNHSIRLTTDKLRIINMGTKKYDNVRFEWKLDNHNLNNTEENDILMVKDDVYPLNGSSNEDVNKTKYDLSTEKGMYEIIFKEIGETRDNYIGSQLFGLTYKKNNTNYNMDDVLLIIRQKNTNKTAVTFRVDFGQLNESQDIVYKHMAGGDALTFAVKLFNDFDQKPPDKQTDVSMDSIVRNGSGRMFLAINGWVCNTSLADTNTFSCNFKFADGLIDNITTAINSRGRIVIVYTNKTENNVYSRYTDDFGQTFSAATNISNLAGLRATSFTYSIATDKIDNYHLCLVPNSYISNGEIAYWANSSDGITWKAANITTYGAPNTPCDIEADSNNVIHIITERNDTSSLFVYHSNFTMSDDPNATSTLMSTLDGYGVISSFSLAIDRNDKLFVYQNKISVMTNGLAFLNSSDGGATWTSQVIQQGVTDKYSDIVIDNPNSVRALFLSDDNTADFSVWYWNSSNGGESYSTLIEIQDSSDITKSLEGMHQMGSSYPVFNKPRGDLKYFFWSDDEGLSQSWYYANYSYPWVDIGMPDNRFSLSNATNGTTENRTIWFSTECFDESNISSIIFSIDNGTGSFKNYSQNNYTSPHYYQSVNVTYGVTANCGKTVNWKWYCNDTANNIYESQNSSFQTYQCPSEGPAASYTLTSGALVMVNSTDARKQTMLFFDQAGITRSIDVPTSGTYVWNLDFAINPKRNESALVTYPSVIGANIYLDIYNGSAFSKKMLLGTAPTNTIHTAGACYRKNGDLIITRRNGTGIPGQNFSLQIWNGVELLNLSGKGFIPTSEVNFAFPFCDPNSDNVMIIWGVVPSPSIVDIIAGILDSTNTIINTTEFIPLNGGRLGLVRAYSHLYEYTNFGSKTFTTSWLKNGTAYVCYSNSTTPAYSHQCTVWDNLQKRWTVHVDGKNNPNANHILQGSDASSSYNNNNFMRAFSDTDSDLHMDYFNGTVFSVSNELSINTIQTEPNNFFRFLNNSDNDGAFFYSLNSRLYYRNWSGTANNFSNPALVLLGVNEIPNQIKIYSDRNTPNIIVGMINSTANILKFLKYNDTDKYPTVFAVPGRTLNNYGFRKYYDLDFYPTSYFVNDTKAPYWNNNLTPTGTFRTNTSTTFSVNWNDDFPTSGLCIFSLNDTGWINDTTRVWTPPAIVTNTSKLRSKRGATIQWYWTCNDSNGNRNVTDVFSKLVVNTPPTLISYQPANLQPIILEGDNITFNVSHADIDGDSIVCLWFVNGTLNQTRSPCSNFTFNYTSGMAGQNFNVTIKADDGYDNTSLQWKLKVTGPPDCENPGINYPETPTPYVWNQSIQINSTCYTGALTFNEVFISINNTFNTSYDEMNRDNITFYYGLENLSNYRGAGLIDLCFLINTMTGENNYDTCTHWNYDIVKNNVTLNFTINSTSPITYRDNLQLNCNASQVGVNIYLYDNNTVLKSGRTDYNAIVNIQYNFTGNLSAGTHNFSCRSDANHQNYTDSRSSIEMIVDQYPTQCELFFIDNPVTLPNKINATNASCGNPEVKYNFTMYREINAGSNIFQNVTNETNKNVTFGVAGNYVYFVNVTGTQNYSKGEQMYILTVYNPNQQPVVNLVNPQNASSDGNDSRILQWQCSDIEENNVNTTIYASNNFANLTISNITTYFNVNSSNDGNESYNLTRVDNRGCNPCYWQVACNDSAMTGYSEIYQFTYTTGKADNVSCTTNAECISNYCDNDGLGLDDDYLCYTPRNISRGITGKTYFHDEIGDLYCDYDADPVTDYHCDERLNNSATGVCNTYGETYFEDTCTNNCALNDTYVNSSFLCRSSAFDASCTADTQCSGITNGTSYCSPTCTYSYPYFENPINASPNFRRYENFTANITIQSQYWGINYSWIGTNATGTWINRTPIGQNGLTNVRFNTSINITVSNGSNVCWRVYANDSKNNLNQSDQHCFTVQDTAPSFNETVNSLNATGDLSSMYWDWNCTDIDGTDVTFTTNSTLFSIGSATGIINDSPVESENATYRIVINCSNGLVATTAFDYMIADQTTPKFNQMGMNNTNPKKGENITVYVNISDGIRLNSTRLFHNFTGGALTNQSDEVFSNNPQNYTSSINISLGYPNVVCWGRWFNDSYNYINSTNLSCVNIANTVPTFNESAPTLNATSRSTTGWDFNCTDIDGAGVTFTDNTSLFNINVNSGIISDSPSETENSTQTINIACSDGTDTNIQSVTYKIGDLHPPYYTNTQNSTPNTYSLSTKSYFNITWNSDNGGFSNFSIAANFSGTWVNYSMFNYTSVYHYNSTLPAGIFSYYFRGNDTYNNENITTYFNFTINKATSVCTLSIPSSLQYGQGVAANCSCTNTDIPSSPILYRNGSDVTSAENGTSKILSAGTWAYSCNGSSTQNFTAADSSGTLTIGRAATQVNLSLNGVENNTILTYSQQITAIYNWVNYTASMYRNGTNINSQNNTALTLARGFYNYSVVINDNQNFTGQYKTFNLTVNQNSSQVVTTINKSKINYTETVFIQGNLIAGDIQINITLDRNNTVLMNYTLSVNTTQSSLSVNYWQFCTIYPGSENYTSSLNCANLSVVDEIMPTVTQISPADSNYSDIFLSVNITFNCTQSDVINLSTASLYISDSLNQSLALNQITTIGGTSNTTIFYANLTPGNYSWLCSVNDTSNNRVNSSIRTILQNFTVDNFPRWSQNQTNDSNVLQGDNVSLSVYWQDDNNLSMIVFAHNQSGTLTNISNITEITTPHNATFYLNISLASGNTICWKQYANDSSNQWNDTSLFCFDITSISVTSSSGGGGGGNSYTNPIPTKADIFKDYIKFINLNQQGTSYIHRSDSNPSPDQVVDFTVFVDNTSGIENLSFKYSIDNKLFFNRGKMHFDNETKSFGSQVSGKPKQTIIYYFVEARKGSAYNRTPEKGYDSFIWDNPYIPPLTIESIKKVQEEVIFKQCIFSTFIERLFVKNPPQGISIFILLLSTLLFAIYSIPTLNKIKIQKKLARIVTSTLVIGVSFTASIILLNMTPEFLCMINLDQNLTIIYLSVIYGSITIWSIFKQLR